MQSVMLSPSFHGVKRVVMVWDTFISVEALGIDGKLEKVVLGLQASLIYPTVFLTQSFIYLGRDTFVRRISAVYPKHITSNRKHLLKTRWLFQENQHEPFTVGLNAVLLYI